MSVSQSTRITVGDQSIEISRQQQIEQNKNSPEAAEAKKISEAQAIKSKAAYKTNTGREFGSDPAKWANPTTASDSGGGNSNPLKLLGTIASAVANPWGTLAAVVTGKRDIM